MVWGRCDLCNLRYASRAAGKVALVRFRARACHSTWRHCPDFRAQPVQPLDEETVSNCPFDSGAVLLTKAGTTKYSMEAGLQDVGGCYILAIPSVRGLSRTFDDALGWMPLGAQYYAFGRRQ